MFESFFRLIGFIFLYNNHLLYLYVINMTNNSLFFVTSPLDQFEIRDLISIVMPILGNINLSITNMTLLPLVVSGR